MNFLINEMSFLNVSNRFENIKDGDDVEISISSPMNDGLILHKYYTSRAFLEKSPKFKEWFDSVDFYKDYIEIGDNGYSGLSDLMLFYKYNGFYSLYINCSRYCHTFALYSRTDSVKIPYILKVLEYMDGNYNSDDLNFNQCLKILRI